MLILLSGLLFIISFFYLLVFIVFRSSSRYSIIFIKLNTLIYRIINSVISQRLFIFFFMFVLVRNVLGNIPSARVPTFFYFETLTLAFLFWFPIIVCVSISDFKAFFSHLLPYGCPVGLMLLLPLVEGFSLIIRPITLIIRLRTNLAAGHIIIYMFSYFTLLNPLLPIPIDILITFLYLLEIFISALQAYIFFSLLVLYGVESV